MAEDDRKDGFIAIMMAREMTEPEGVPRYYHRAEH